jgi:MFS family permease
MVEAIKKSLRESAAARWTAMAVVSFTMLCGYYVADVAAPLKPLIEQQLHWTSAQYGFFTSSYGWFNVFLGMLVIGGIILDKKGPRFAGMLASILMVLGCGLKWWAMSTHSLDGQTLFGANAQVMLASIGFATFGMGIELCGITATKIIVKWFKGYEIALAMGLQVAIARIGTSLALGVSAPIANAFKVSTPILVGALLLGVGLVAYIFYMAMDKKLDASDPEGITGDNPEDEFRFADIFSILGNKGFWYIAILCALFYSGVFPFLKYAPDLMVQKFGVSEKLSGIIPSLLPIGAMLLTPTFGRIYDKKGKGASIMVLGSILIMTVHIIFTVPFLNNWLIAVFAMLLLGVGFSLVPSAMWPSVPKLIPERQLGTAYSLIFFLQNLVALMFAPWLIGLLLDKYCVTGKDMLQKMVDGKMQDITIVHYNYMLPMAVFTCFGLLAIVFALLLKTEDKAKGYGLELPNQKA